MRPQTGIRLPQGLLEQLGEKNDDSRGPRSGKPHRPQLSRKEARKQNRADKKQRKASYFTSATHGAKRVAEMDHPESPKRKKAKLTDSKPSGAPESHALVKRKEIASKPLRDSKYAESAGKLKVKPRTALEKLAERAEPVTLPRTQAERNEDAYIAFLEANLAGKKGGKTAAGYGKEFDDDGLGDLLVDLDTIGAPPSRKPQQMSFSSQDSELEEDGVSGRSDDEDIDKEKSFDDVENEGWDGFERSAEYSETEGSETPALLPDPAAVKATPAAGSRYVPPHLRDRPADSEESEALLKLSRQLKGLLNRMSEQNLANILNDVEEAYRKHRRHGKAWKRIIQAAEKPNVYFEDVTSSLTSLIIEGISSHSILLDSFVVLHAAFVSSLHKIVGIEFAAYFVQNVISLYERHHSTLEITPDGSSQADDTRGKECSNLIILLSELYNFQVISCVLIYDVIRSLLNDQLNEFNVELLLKLLRNSGQQLRQDDPTALKDIIQIVQEKTSTNTDLLRQASRTQFMIETLVNLKNNKSKHGATQHAGGDAVERMKKFLAGLSKKRHLMAHDPLRVSLDDLHSAESKGKWWLVGAAWGGDPLVERQANAKRDAATSQENVPENALLKLARKQGMNTDIRRNVFVVIMSSDDYVDACERLAQLNLTEVQQREIVRVILHCLGNEKSYNPYYTLVCQHLCRTSHSYKITLQFCLWDFLRDLGETSVGGAEVIKNLKDDDAVEFDVKKISPARMRNIARAYAWWVAKDSTTLAIFKPVDFMALKIQSRHFLKEFFAQLFISSQSSSPIIDSNTTLTRNRGALEEIFIKATRIQSLALGLVYFLSETFRKQDEDGSTAFSKWASGVAVETLRTGLDIIPTL